MALQASGEISLNDLATEFSDSAPNSMSEFYRGGNLVSAIAYETATAASLGGSNSTNARHPAVGGYDPQINTFSRLYTQALWADGAGGIITFDRNFTVNVTGSYSYYVAYYIQGTIKTATHTLYVAGTQVATHSLTAGNSTASATGTLSVTSGQTIRVTGTGGSAGWAAMTVYIGGSTPNNNTVQIANNSSVPESGQISLNGFYSTAS